MNVTSAARRCTLVLNIHITGNKVVMFSLKNIHYMWKLRVVISLVV